MPTFYGRLKVPCISLAWVSKRAWAFVVLQPGPDCSNWLTIRPRKCFAQELDKVVGDLARVVRSKRLVSVRVSGLDDSVTQEMVVDTAAEAGNCDAGSVKAGEIVAGGSGMSSVVLRCPIPTEKALAEAGRFLVGWSSARVRLLELHPMRCFRCMFIGHTRPICPKAVVDPSRLCYRCGLEGHLARTCTGAPNCAVCAASGRPASHVMGGRNCRPPKANRKAAPTPRRESRQATEEAAAMSS